MKITIKNKDDLDMLKKLFEMRIENISFGSLYNTIFESYSEYNSLLKKNNDLYSSLLNILGISGKDKDFLKASKIHEFNNFAYLDTQKYVDNPFYKNIKLTNIKNNNISVLTKKYKPNELFIYKDFSTDPNYFYAEHTYLGFFNEEFSYPEIEQDGVQWMSITPHEINTMEKAIDEASGNVLVLGLGIGYFPYIVSLKENVNQITILEKDKDIINTFKTCILPQFKNKEKIKIIETDVYDFLAKKSAEPKYNYCFIDLWHDAKDGLKYYLKLKKYEKKNVTYFYWIEENILEYFRRFIITLMEEQFYGSKPEDYQNNKGFENILINNLYKSLLDVEISSYSQVIDFLSNKNLKNIIKNNNL